MVSMALLVLTGCGDYSLPKAQTKTHQNLAISNVDSRYVITSKVNDALSVRGSLESQLIVYTENTVKPTTDMKKSLKQTIQSIQEKYRGLSTELENYNLGSDYIAAQKSVVSILKSAIRICEDMEKALQNNDFAKLSSLGNQFNNLMAQLQNSL